MAEIEGELRTLSPQLKGTQQQVDASDARLAAWQQKIENQISGAGVSGGGDTATIKRVLKMLMKQHPYTDFPAFE